MKKLKSVLAMLLVLAMVMSCAVTAFAADESGSPAATTEKTEGMKSLLQEQKWLPEQDENPGYADDDMVRAIVLMEDAPEIEMAARGTRAAERYSQKLLAQQQKVYSSMGLIPAHLFTGLLNAFSVDIAYGRLEELAQKEGVSSVHVANSYAAPQPLPAEPNAMSSGAITGNDVAQATGFTGESVVIAVIDTGLNTTHEAFQDAGKLCENGSPALGRDCLDAAAVPGKYLSVKVPFSYDYADEDDDVTDYQGHGTHVSGIAAGDAYDENGSNIFRGAAPAAQLLSMKVFHDDEPGTTDDIFFRALEDAYRLGADIINMSLGSQNGFTYDESLEGLTYGNIYKRLAKAGIILTISAGNEGSMADNAATGYIGPDYTDYGTVGSPSTYEGTVSVAAMENGSYPAFVITVDGQKFIYNDSSIPDVNPTGLWITTFGGKENEFVTVKTAEGRMAIGAEADYADVDVTGKIAVVQRGEITFQEKLNFAAAAGAVGLIVCNNQADKFGMVIDDFQIPAIAVDQAAQDAFLNSASGKVSTGTEKELVDNDLEGQMSSFSGWGADPGLTFKPTLTSVGGNVYSSVIGADNAYDVYSGTSMSAPNLAGTFANLLDYLNTAGYGDNKVERAELAKALLESSAGILTNPEIGEPYQVRRQGAGLASFEKAVSCLENIGYIEDPLKELGDGLTDTVSFDVTLRNTTDADVTYDTVEAALIADYVHTAEDGSFNTTMGISFLSAAEEVTVACKVADFAVEQISVPAHSSVTVNVTLTMSPDTKAYYDSFPNGTYLEGYVTFDSNGAPCQNHASFLGYYGDWTQAPVLEAANSGDFITFIAAIADQLPAGVPLWQLQDIFSMNFCYTTPNMVYGATVVGPTDPQPFFFLGGNVMNILVDNGPWTTPYNPAYASFSTPEADGLGGVSNCFAASPSLLRNARNLIMTVTDAETGEVYYTDDTEYLPKNIFDPENKMWLPLSAFVWDGTDASGSYVPTGTVAKVSFQAVLPYGPTEVQDPVWSFDVTVDYVAPVVETAEIDLETGILTVTASDDRYLQGVYLAAGDMILDAQAFAPETLGQKGEFTFDLSDYMGVLDDVEVHAVDYATNENGALVPLFKTGDPATVTQVAPNGTERIQCTTGDMIEFEECAYEKEGYRFVGWVEERANHLTEDELAEVNIWYPGDEIYVKGDATYYALYAKCTVTPVDGMVYQKTDEIREGELALVGYHGEKPDLEHPRALDADLSSLDVTTLADCKVDVDASELETDDMGLCWSAVAIGDAYALMNNETFQCLTYADGGLTTVAFNDMMLNSLWTMEPGGWDTVTILNAEDPNMLLTFDYMTDSFCIMDNSVPIEEYGPDVFPSMVYSIYTYYNIQERVVVDFYTTELMGVCHFSAFEDFSHAWYHEAVDYVLDHDIMKGVSDTRFAPEGTVTRGQMVTVLYRLAGEPEVAELSTFQDVSPNAYYAAAVAWAQDNEIVMGITSTRFAPENKVTREQIAAILWRFQGKPAGTGEVKDFADADKVTGYARDAISWAVGANILKGNDKNQLRPGSTATRAEFAAIVMRLQDGSYKCPEMYA